MVENSQGTQRGHTLEIMLLVVAWLAGIAAGGYLLAVRLVPAIEQHIASAVESTVLPQTSYRVGVSVAGYETTLSGKVSDADERQRLLRAAKSVPGVRHVVDELQIAADPRLLDFPLGVLPPTPRSNDKTLTPEVPSDNKPRTRVLGAISTPWRAPDVWKSSTSSGIEIAAATDVLADVDLESGSIVNTDRAPEVIAEDKALAEPEAVSEIEPAAEVEIVSDGEPAGEVAVVSEDGTAAAVESDAEDETIVGNEIDPDVEAAAAGQTGSADEAPAPIGDDAGSMAVSEPETTAELEVAADSVAGAMTETETTEVVYEGDGLDGSDNADVIDDDSALDVSDTRQTNDTDTVAELPVDAPLPQADVRAPQALDDTTSSGASGSEMENNAGEAESDAVLALRRDFDALGNTRIEFQIDSDVPTADSLDVLDTIAELLRNHPKVFVNIGGHTDSAGEVFDNLFLSQSRSNAVRDYLTDRGVSPYRLLASGYGEGLPIASNETAQGRAANRRIEFEFSEDSTL